jgi:hypothetical protein
MLPADSQILQAGDHVLFCGKEVSQGRVEANLNNAYALKYLLTGFEEPQGYFFRWLSHRVTK